MKTSLTLLTLLLSLGIITSASAQEFIDFTAVGRNPDNDNPGYTADYFDMNYLQPTPRATSLNVSYTDPLGANITMQGSTVPSGFFAARNQVSMSVSNVQSEGYQATTAQGSHTQVTFFTPGALATSSVYNWHVTGTTSSTVPGANVNAGLSFLAGDFGGADLTTMFSNPSTATLIGPGNLSYTLPLLLDKPIDLYFYSGSYFETKKSQGDAILNGNLSGFSNFSNTYILDSIDLFDSNGDSIVNWTMEETSMPGVVLFDQNGRTAAARSPVPEPTTFLFLALGGTLILAHRRRN
ncbi:PEP-CTERM sorting domain-containing protein [Armatimonas sp.]|uniref:PEP-CTERM sorting domain-containing protein n=1 Tax=Armatimonas sp. TaxID=1872638 RepID=UPI00286D1806|nr:PEP-CTERM sorting domain-containing protein [Armatimonas sp.]